jgi:hypothetical protein
VLFSSSIKTRPVGGSFGNNFSQFLSIWGSLYFPLTFEVYVTEFWVGGSFLYTLSISLHSSCLPGFQEDGFNSYLYSSVGVMCFLLFTSFSANSFSFLFLY